MSSEDIVETKLDDSSEVVETKRGRKPTQESIIKKNETLDKKIKKLKDRNRTILINDTIMLLAWLCGIVFMVYFNFLALLICFLIVSATTFTKKQENFFNGIPVIAFVLICFVCAPFVLIIDIVNVKKREKEILDLSSQKVDVDTI